MIHRSKDWDVFFRTGRRRFRVWTGGDSWSGSQRGVLIGSLLRANANCSQHAAVFPLRMRAILRVIAEAQVWGGYSISVLRRVVSYLAAKTEEPATAAFWRLLTFILRSVCSAPLQSPPQPYRFPKRNTTLSIPVHGDILTFSFQLKYQRTIRF